MINIVSASGAGQTLHVLKRVQALGPGSENIMPRTPDHGVVCSVRLSPWLPLSVQIVHTDASIHFPTHSVPLKGLEKCRPTHHLGKPSLWFLWTQKRLDVDLFPGLCEFNLTSSTMSSQLLEQNHTNVDMP